MNEIERFVDSRLRNARERTRARARLVCVRVLSKFNKTTEFIY